MESFFPIFHRECNLQFTQERSSYLHPKFRLKKQGWNAFVHPRLDIFTQKRAAIPFQNWEDFNHIIRPKRENI